MPHVVVTMSRTRTYSFDIDGLFSFFFFIRKCLFSLTNFTVKVGLFEYDVNIFFHTVLFSVFITISPHSLEMSPLMSKEHSFKTVLKNKINGYFF